MLFELSIYPLLQRAVPQKGLGLSPVCLSRCGQEVGHCESLNSLPQEPVYIFVNQVFLQFYSSAHLLLLTLTFYRILSRCPLLGVNTEERKKGAHWKRLDSIVLTRSNIHRRRISEIFIYALSSRKSR